VRGEFARYLRHGRARGALIVVQVTASALLFICAGVFLRSALRASSLDPGLRLSDNVIIDIVNEPLRAPLMSAVYASPFVSLVAASWPGAPLDPPRAAFGRPAAATETGGGMPRGLPVGYRFVSSDYFAVLGVDVVRGRVFTKEEASARSAVAVISESTAREIWPDADAIGQVLHLEADPNSGTRGSDEPALPAQTFTVVGIVRDAAGFRLAGFSEAGVYVPTSLSAADATLIVRVHGDPESARRALLERLSAIDPNLGLVLTLRTLSRFETYPLQVAFWLSVTLGGLALVLTLSGIFSVLSYLVEQRTKEIGVRIALGATTAQVARQVLWQSLRLVGVGLVAGAGLAWGLATLLMATPAASRIGSVVEVFDPLAYTLSPLLIMAACVLAASIPALRAARVDPIATLRQDA
jgi:putative ABC transport system permease protein